MDAIKCVQFIEYIYIHYLWFPSERAWSMILRVIYILFKLFNHAKILSIVIIFFETLNILNKLECDVTDNPKSVNLPT